MEGERCCGMRNQLTRGEGSDVMVSCPTEVLSVLACHREGGEGEATHQCRREALSAGEVRVQTWRRTVRIDPVRH